MNDFNRFRQLKTEYAFWHGMGASFRAFIVPDETLSRNKKRGCEPRKGYSQPG